MIPPKNLSLLRIKNQSIKCALVFLPIMATTLPSYAESFTAKRAGQGFTGITQDFTSSLSNPALLTKFDDDDDVYFSINVGLLGSDKYEVIDTLDTITENLDILVEDIDAIGSQNFESVEEVELYNDDLFEQVDVIVEDFVKIDEKIVKISNGLNLQVIIPNNYLSLGLYTSQYGRYGGFMDYSEGDEQILNDSVLAGELDLADLDSATQVVGYSIAEAGIMAAYPVIKHVNYDFSIGTKIKYQRIDLYYNRSTVEDFDDDDFDPTDDQYITDESNTNVDLGLYVAWGDDRQWNAALVTNNLMGQTVVHEDQDITFNLDSSATIGLSYQINWLSLATEIDLTDRETFANLEASKYAGAGAEFRLAESLQFRLGYRTDLNDVDDDIYTAGIGISPGDVLALDIAAFTGDNDTIGAALQVSLKL